MFVIRSHGELYTKVGPRTRAPRILYVGNEVIDKVPYPFETEHDIEATRFSSIEEASLFLENVLHSLEYSSFQYYGIYEIKYECVRIFE